MKRRQLLVNYFHIFIIILLVIGICFRFSNLGAKVYWNDETATSFAISGYTPQELYDGVQKKITTPEQILKYYTVNSEKTSGDMISYLYKEDVHPPFYFILARFWSQLFGSSPEAIRALSAVISLIIFPSIYWLCQELFNTSSVGWMAMGIIAVSPFHVIYAQEARMYSLWIVEILLSSALLLRAIRLNKKESWLFYGLILTISLYTYLANIFIAIAQGIYMLLIEGFKLSKRFLSYLITSLIAILIFIPWLLVVATNLSSFKSSSNWVNASYSFKLYISMFTQNFVSVFMDFWYFRLWYPDSNFPHIPWARFLIPFTLLIVAYSFYFLVRKTSWWVWSFVLLLCLINIGTTILPDLMSGGIRGIVPRYLIPLFIGVEISVAYLLAMKTHEISTKTWQSQLWRLITVILITGGVVSCLLNSPTPGSLHKRTPGEQVPPIVNYINQKTNPILVVATPMHYLMPLVYRLDSDVKIIIDYTLDTNNLSEIQSSFSSVFLLESDQHKFVNLDKQPLLEKELIFQGDTLFLSQMK
ncbi:MAG: glycosyltransferase family 39 protein [Crocosphaera sp.]|nr:glycosyltransferase family 39 protein [Crocosphaera sp.]